MFRKIGLKFLLPLLVIIQSLSADAQIQELTIEYPVIINGEVSAFSVLYQSDSSFTANAELIIYKTRRLIDSTVFKRINLSNLEIKQGLGKHSLVKSWNEKQSLDEKRILAFTNNFPPGEYVSILTLRKSNQQFISHWQVDSQINSSAQLNSAVNESIAKSIKKVEANKGKLKTLVSDAKKGKFKAKRKKEKIENKAQDEMQKSLARKMPGLSLQTEMSGSNQRLSFFYDKTYLGYKEVDIKEEITNSAKSKISNTKGQIETEAKETLSDYRTLFEQYKEKKADQMKKDGMQGSISVDNYFDSGQEEYSPNDNIYSEVYGDTKLKLLGIPFQLQGYYTTQDRNRNIKASYIRLKYDVQSSKDELEENLQEFKKDYSSKKSDLFAKKSVYGSYLERLKGSKTDILNGLKKDINLESISNFNWDDIAKNPYLLNQLDTNKLIEQISEKAIDNLDSTGQAEKSKQNVLKRKEQAQERVAKVRKQIEQLEEIEEKVRKYASMIEQMQKTMHFDSAFVMSKIKNETGSDDYSKNALLKKSKELLPKNDYSKFTKGLKNLNIGILSEYESDYSMAGQTMKGGGIEYELKGVDVGLSVGRTEYVSRDLANLDTYNNLLAKASYEVSDKHKVKFIYFTYKPNQKQANNSFYSSLRNNQYSFNNPTQIGNIIYQGAVSKSVDYRLEVAGSLQKESGDKVQHITGQQLAYKGALDYVPNKFPLGFNLEYERVGKDFTNETLAFIRKNFETKKLTTFGEFFKGFLRAKVSFQQLTQNPGEELLRKNTKWGFEARTVSKRYPNIQLSYKPFTTFTSVFDTFAVGQRNLFGEVIQGKATYQLKRNGNHHRWNIVFNRNRTNIDTLDYQTDLLQAGYILNTKGNMYMLQVGRMEMPKNSVSINNQENYFVRASEQFEVFPNLPLQLGQDIAWNSGGLNRLGLQIGSAYSLKSKPLTVRIQFRYMTYKNSENIQQKIYGTMLGLTYDFHFKSEK